MKPSINGFSITSLKTMDTWDGVAISCNLYRGTKNLGHYYHAGDGGEGRLDNWKTHMELDKELETWKKDDPIDIGTEKPFEYGWDVDRLIAELAALDRMYKLWKKALKKGHKSIVTVDDNKHVPLCFSCVSDDRDRVRAIAYCEASKNRFTDEKIEIYITEDDFKKEV